MKTLKEIINEQSINEGQRFQDITKSKFQGGDVLIKSVKDIVNTDLNEKIQMLDACQTCLGNALTCLTIATSDMRDNYNREEIKSINNIYNSIQKCHIEIGNIIDSYEDEDDYED